MRRKPLVTMPRAAVQSVPRPIVVPDVAGDVAAVRAGLPNFPVYDPPIAAAVKPPPLVTDGVGDGYESASRTILCTDIPLFSDAPAMPVYATQRRWRAIDVYISTDFAGAAGTAFLSLAIFAISRGVRTLVAQGRTRATPGHRVMTARAVCDRFEVVVQRNAAPTATTQFATITVVASDESEFSPQDEWQIGSIAQSSDDATMSPSSNLIVVEGAIRPVLTAIHAININAADRWLMVFDSTSSGAALNGLAPVFQFYVPANGDGQVLFESSIFRFRPFVNALSVGASSTPGTMTFAIDVYRNVWFR